MSSRLVRAAWQHCVCQCSRRWSSGPGRNLSSKTRPVQAPNSSAPIQSTSSNPSTNSVPPHSSRVNSHEDPIEKTVFELDEEGPRDEEWLAAIKAAEEETAQNINIGSRYQTPHHKPLFNFNDVLRSHSSGADTKPGLFSDEQLDEVMEKILQEEGSPIDFDVDLITHPPPSSVGYNHLLAYYRSHHLDSEREREREMRAAAASNPPLRPVSELSQSLKPPSLPTSDITHDRQQQQLAATIANPNIPPPPPLQPYVLTPEQEEDLLEEQRQAENIARDTALAFQQQLYRTLNEVGIGGEMKATQRLLSGWQSSVASKCKKLWRSMQQAAAHQHPDLARQLVDPGAAGDSSKQAEASPEIEEEVSKLQQRAQQYVKRNPHTQSAGFKLLSSALLQLEPETAGTVALAALARTMLNQHLASKATFTRVSSTIGQALNDEVVRQKENRVLEVQLETKLREFKQLFREYQQLRKAATPTPTPTPTSTTPPIDSSNESSTPLTVRPSTDSDSPALHDMIDEPAIHSNSTSASTSVDTKTIETMSDQLNTLRLEMKQIRERIVTRRVVSAPNQNRIRLLSEQQYAEHGQTWTVPATLRIGALMLQILLRSCYFIPSQLAKVNGMSASVASATAKTSSPTESASLSDYRKNPSLRNSRIAWLSSALRRNLNVDLAAIAKQKTGRPLGDFIGKPSKSDQDTKVDTNIDSILLGTRGTGGGSVTDRALAESLLSPLLMQTDEFRSKPRPAFRLEHTLMLVRDPHSNPEPLVPKKKKTEGGQEETDISDMEAEKDRLEWVLLKDMVQPAKGASSRPLDDNYDPRAVDAELDMNDKDWLKVLSSQPEIDPTPVETARAAAEAAAAEVAAAEAAKAKAEAEKAAEANPAPKPKSLAQLLFQQHHPPRSFNTVPSSTAAAAPAPAAIDPVDSDRADQDAAAAAHNQEVDEEVFQGSRVSSLTSSQRRTLKLQEQKGMSRMNRIGVKRVQLIMITLDPEVWKALEMAVGASARIVHEPMLVKPKPWIGPNDGAYLSQTASLMRSSPRAPGPGFRLQQRALQTADLSRVYESLNYLSATPWRIHERVLDVMHHYYEKQGGGVCELPAKLDKALPEPPVDERDERAWKAYSREVARIMHENRNEYSQRCDFLYRMRQAQKFRSRVFYFPLNLDFRGRAYPVPPHLNHLGSDVSRGMIMFGEGRQLGSHGLRWLMIHTANLYGMDKLSLDDRYAWMESQLPNVLATADDPYRNGRDAWWMKAENPWQFLGACFELAAALRSRDPHLFVSHLTVHQDGSCNGLQHYAALGRDEWGGKAVNLSPSTKPQDIYTGVLEHVCQQLERDAAAGHELAKFVVGKINRKIVKQTVMTSVYGVTLIGGREQIESKVRDRADIIFPEPVEENRRKACMYLAKLTLNSLGTLFRSAQAIMDWLRECARLIARTQHPVAWTTPLGLPVIQPYMHDLLRKRVSKDPEHQQQIDESFFTPENASDLQHIRPDARRQKMAFPPNFVHSLDATHMMMTALACKYQGLSFASVHDSYWTHAGTMEHMNTALREQFVSLYEHDILNDLYSQLQQRYPHLKNLFPPPPPQGKLNLRSVMDSLYFFS